MAVAPRPQHAGSLPPGLDGDERGSVTLTVSSAEWLGPGTERSACAVRVRWWGEAGEGHILRPPAPAGTAAANYAAGLTGRQISQTVAYTLRCGAGQLKRYFEDMRELVLEILEIPPPAGPFDPPPARPPLRAFAYLHLGLAHLDVPFAAVLPAYALSPGQDEELARLAVCLATAFTHPVDTLAPVATAGARGWGALDKSAGWSSDGAAGVGVCGASGAQAGDGSSGEHCGDTWESGDGAEPWGQGGAEAVRLDPTASDSRPHAAASRRYSEVACGSFARRHTEGGLGSVSSSFALNEKRALFDATLPLLPGGGSGSRPEARGAPQRAACESGWDGGGGSVDVAGGGAWDEIGVSSRVDGNFAGSAVVPPLEEVLPPSRRGHGRSSIDRRLPRYRGVTGGQRPGHPHEAEPQLHPHNHPRDQPSQGVASDSADADWVSFPTCDGAPEGAPGEAILFSDADSTDESDAHPLAPGRSQPGQPNRRAVHTTGAAGGAVPGRAAHTTDSHSARAPPWPDAPPRQPRRRSSSSAAPSPGSGSLATRTGSVLDRAMRLCAQIAEATGASASHPLGELPPRPALGARTGAVRHGLPLTAGVAPHLAAPVGGSWAAQQAGVGGWACGAGHSGYGGFTPRGGRPLMPEGGLDTSLQEGELQRAEGEYELLQELFFEASFGEDAVTAALGGVAPCCCGEGRGGHACSHAAGQGDGNDEARAGKGHVGAGSGLAHGQEVALTHSFRDETAGRPPPLAEDATRSRLLSPVPGSPRSDDEDGAPSDLPECPHAVAAEQAGTQGQQAARPSAEAHRLFLCLEVGRVRVTTPVREEAQPSGASPAAAGGSLRKMAAVPPCQKPAPRRASFYLVCRFNPELLGEPTGDTSGGHYEGHKLRTGVAWGRDEARLGLRHMAPLVGRPAAHAVGAKANPLPCMTSQGGAGAGAGSGGAAGQAFVAAAANGSLSSSGHDAGRTALDPREAPLSGHVPILDRWATPNELVLEVWEIESATQHEDLAALLRCRVGLPGGIESRLYATRVSDGWLQACNPFDGREWGQVEVTVTLGTAAQHAASAALRSAVATLQAAARGWLARRGMCEDSCGEGCASGGEDSHGDDAGWRDFQRWREQQRASDARPGGGATLKPRRTRQGGRDGTSGGSGSGSGQKGSGDRLPAPFLSDSRAPKLGSGAAHRHRGAGRGGGRDARSGSAWRPHGWERASRAPAAAAASAAGVAQWQEEEGGDTDDGYRGIDAGRDVSWSADPALVRRPGEGGSDLQPHWSRPGTQRPPCTPLVSAAQPAPQGVSIRRWHFVVRVARASDLRALLPEIRDRSGLGGGGSLGDGLGWVYVHYRWEGGGVVAPLTGETPPARCGDGVSFGHERSLRVPTSLSDSEFRAFLQTQSVSFEVWRVPPGGKQANLFTHTLLGTATASLAEAVTAGSRGSALECRVTPATGGALRAATTDRGPCSTAGAHAGTAGLCGTGSEGWGTGRVGSGARGGCLGASSAPYGAGAAAFATATLFVGFAIGTDDPISAPLELPSPSSLQPAPVDEWRWGAGPVAETVGTAERPEDARQVVLPPPVLSPRAVPTAVADIGAAYAVSPSAAGDALDHASDTACTSTAADALSRLLNRAAEACGGSPAGIKVDFNLDPVPPLSPSLGWGGGASGRPPACASHERAGATGAVAGIVAGPWGNATGASCDTSRGASWHEPRARPSARGGAVGALWAPETDLDVSCDASARLFRDPAWDASRDASRDASSDASAMRQLKLTVARDVEYAQRVLASLGARQLSHAAVGLSSGIAHDDLPHSERDAPDPHRCDGPPLFLGTRVGVHGLGDVENARFAPSGGRMSSTSAVTAPTCSSAFGVLPVAASAALKPPAAAASAEAAAPLRRETIRLRVSSADLPGSECDHAAAGAAYRVRVVLPGAVCIDSGPALPEPALSKRHRPGSITGVEASRFEEIGRGVSNLETMEVQDGAEEAEEEQDRGAWPLASCALRVRVHLSHTFSVGVSAGSAAPQAELQLWRMAGAGSMATPRGVGSHRTGGGELSPESHEDVMVGCAFISLSGISSTSERPPVSGTAQGEWENGASGGVAGADGNAMRPLLVVRKVDGLTTDGFIHAVVASASDGEGAAAGAIAGGATVRRPAGGTMGSTTGIPVWVSADAAACAVDEAGPWDETDGLAPPPPALASTVGRWHRRDRSGAGPHGSALSSCQSIDHVGADSGDADAPGMGASGAPAAPTLAFSLAACLRDLDDISASLHDRLLRSGAGGGPVGPSAGRDRTGPLSAPDAGCLPQHASTDWQLAVPACPAPAQADVALVRAASDDTTDEDAAGLGSPDGPLAQPATPLRRPVPQKGGALLSMASPRTSSAEKLPPSHSALSPQALKRIARILHSKPEPARSTESDSD